MISGRDAVEEFIGAGVSPLGWDEFPEFELKYVKLEYFDEPVPLPTLEVVRNPGENNISLVSQIRHTVEVLVGPYTKREHNSRLSILGNLPRLNCVLEYSTVPYGERDGFKSFENKRKNKDGKTSMRGKRKPDMPKIAVKKRLKMAVVEESGDADMNVVDETDIDENLGGTTATAVDFEAEKVSSLET